MLVDVSGRSIRCLFIHMSSFGNLGTSLPYACVVKSVCRKGNTRNPIQSSLIAWHCQPYGFLNVTCTRMIRANLRELSAAHKYSALHTMGKTIAADRNREDESFL